MGRSNNNPNNCRMEADRHNEAPHQGNTYSSPDLIQSYHDYGQQTDEQPGPSQPSTWGGHGNMYTTPTT